MKHIASITTLTLVAAAGFADAAAPAAVAAPALTQSANLALTSNYVWRGVSQNSNSIAVQGGFDIAHTSGLSAGVWASSLSSGTEVDLYANYGFKVASVDLSVGYIAYTYQSDVSATFSEVNVAATYAGVTAKVSKEVTNAASGTNEIGFTDHGYYYELGYTYSIPAVKGLDLGLHYGWADTSDLTNEDYSVALTYPVAGFAATVAYSNVPGNTSKEHDLYSLTLKKSF